MKEVLCVKWFKSAIILLIALLLCAAMSASMAETGTLTLPKGTKSIQAEAFRNDKSVKKVVLPEGITSIGANAFTGSGLTSINLPASLKTISDTAFGSLKNVTVTAKKGTVG